MTSGCEEGKNSRVRLALRAPAQPVTAHGLQRWKSTAAWFRPLFNQTLLFQVFSLSNFGGQQTNLLNENIPLVRIWSLFSSLFDRRSHHLNVVTSSDGGSAFWCRFGSFKFSAGLSGVEAQTFVFTGYRQAPLRQSGWTVWVVGQLPSAIHPRHRPPSLILRSTSPPACESLLLLLIPVPILKMQISV